MFKASPKLPEITSLNIDRRKIMNEDKIKSFYTYLQSEQTAQQFLFDCYQNIEGINPEVKSYENCYSFIYYIKHGLHFYETGKKLTDILQPILSFYGMIHLIKAVLLTKRPHYPETTKLLAHGVSSRKRKKRNYTFMKDEITIHNNGLYPYFSEHLFGIKRLFINKFNMQDLLILIPEMSSLFTFHNQQSLINIGKINEKRLEFPLELLDHYHLTTRSFLRRLEPYLPEVLSSNIDHEHIQIELATPITNSSGPFFFNTIDQSISFPLNRTHFFPISEIMVHYLLLYNLSMLSRYETEWWGDLIATKANIDYPFITHFLNHSSKKIPLLLGHILYQSHLEVT